MVKAPILDGIFHIDAIGASSLDVGLSTKNGSLLLDGIRRERGQKVINITVVGQPYLRKRERLGKE